MQVLLPSLLVEALGCALDVFFTYSLTFGLGVIPALGLEGAALGATVSGGTMLACYITLAQVIPPGQPETDDDAESVPVSLAADAEQQAGADTDHMADAGLTVGQERTGQAQPFLDSNAATATSPANAPLLEHTAAAAMPMMPSSKRRRSSDAVDVRLAVPTDAIARFALSPAQWKAYWQQFGPNLLSSAMEEWQFQVRHAFFVYCLPLAHTRSWRADRVVSSCQHGTHCCVSPLSGHHVVPLRKFCYPGVG